MTAGFSVEPDGVTRLAGQLDRAGSALFDHTGDLEGTPDAGRSSDEVGSALGDLAAALAGLAQHVGALSQAAEACAEAYRRTDDDTQVRFTIR